ncbi:MAG: hypothetical protein ACXVBO_18560, partial [Isosphaeraceae bacterium]
QRSLRRGPPWLGLVGLSQADDALFSGSTFLIILDLIRGVELVEARDNHFLQPRLRLSRSAGTMPLDRPVEGVGLAGAAFLG